MRWIVVGLGIGLAAFHTSAARAEEERRTSERVLGSVISGILGGPQQPPEAAYTEQERERLVSLLQSGEYATSRQGESVDLMVFGIPLTRIEHVYTAKPIQPSQTSSRQAQPR